MKKPKLQPKVVSTGIYKNILAIFSDDDQWVHPDEIKKFRNNLGAKIITKKKMGHFDNVDKIPEILKFIK